MRSERWREWFRPPSLFMSAALVSAVAFPALLSAGPPTIAAGPLRPACPAAAGQPTALDVQRRTGGAAASTAAELSALGELTGRSLNLKTAAGTSIGVQLPPESFVAPRAGDVVVYGMHSPVTGSEIHAVNIATGCDATLARPNDIVRSAVLDPAGTALYVHAVTADGRHDTGITRHDLSTGTASRVMDPLPVSDEFGPTFSTELSWSVAGDSLAVQSCGISHCRTRILDQASGLVEAIDDGHGTLVGLTVTTAYVYADLHGLPSPLLAFNRQSGLLTTLAEDAFDASVQESGSGSKLTIETAAGTLEVTE